MKIKTNKLIIYIIIGIVILVIFGFIIKSLGNNKKEDNINLNKVSNNHMVDDNIVMNLYSRYNPERELLFNLIGSDINKDYYGYYYKNKKIRYKDLDDVVKNIILINDADYKTGKYDKNNNCYYMSNTDFGVIYEKLFGNDDYNITFNEDYEPEVIVDKDNICIGNSNGGNYTKVIDTYMVNGITNKNDITIYERVAFIKITDDYLYYYKDVDMKDLVYKLEITNKLDMSFVNDHNKVSNVLLKYQDEFDLYEYKYKKGVDSYYFESISR